MQKVITQSDGIAEEMKGKKLLRHMLNARETIII
jgi:hypothetical protein